MEINFDDVFNSFKSLSDVEKQQVIIDFLKKNIITLKKINSDAGNVTSNNDMHEIANVSISDRLDFIYKLLHVMTEQMELFMEKVSNDFFE